MIRGRFRADLVLYTMFPYELCDGFLFGKQALWNILFPVEQSILVLLNVPRVLSIMESSNKWRVSYEKDWIS